MFFFVTFYSQLVIESITFVSNKIKFMKKKTNEMQNISSYAIQRMYCNNLIEYQRVREKLKCNKALE